MDANRIDMLLANYAAKLPESGVPAGVKSLWDAAAACRAAFDLEAEDLSAMLHAAFDGAAGVINYAGSVQPLNGLFLLAAQKPEELRQALSGLTGEYGDPLSARQVRMQQFAARCNELLADCADAKRSYEQNLRSAMAVLGVVRPEENFLYKATEARYLADMIGCQTDVSSGAHFSLEGFYGMCQVIADEIRWNEKLAALIPQQGRTMETGCLNLLVYDMLLNAGPKKLGLFGDEEPLIRTRSRAGQANQERAVRIAQLQQEIDGVKARIAGTDARIASLAEPELVGMRCTSRAFGAAEILRVEGQRLIVMAGGAERRMVTPGCFLQGHLTPEDPAAVQYYHELAGLRTKRHEMENEIINLEGQIDRLRLKP
ncbi:MAG: hypothetical protein IJ343_04055 [Clostridia bacterium]|nr:hypothetical protein [Clostridia bacterium]